jgi:hypothetical protein
MKENVKEIIKSIIKEEPVKCKEAFTNILTKKVAKTFNGMQKSK